MSEAPSRTNWLWHSLHLLLTLSVPLLLTVMLGCKQAKAKKEDLGPAMDIKLLDDALVRVAEGASFNTLAVGQYLQFSDIRRLENEETAITLGGRRIDVIDRVDTPEQARFTLHITDSLRQNDGKFRTKLTEEALWLDKVPVAPASLRALGTSTRRSMTAEAIVQSTVQAMADDEEKKKVTLHHLRESDASIAPPTAVKMRADCGGLNPCELRVHYIQFDLVIWENTSDAYQKISFDFGFSTQTPYLPFGKEFDQLSGLLITDCRSTFVPLESRNVYVRDCLDLEDFKK